MKSLHQFFRLVLFLILGMLGMAMALIFMISTTIAMAILYVVARIKGRPFGVKAYWAQRQASMHRFRPGQGQPFKQYDDRDVIDVEAREIP